MNLKDSIQMVDKQLSPKKAKMEINTSKLDSTFLRNIQIEEQSFITNNTTLAKGLKNKKKDQDKREIILNEPFMLGCNYHM